MRLCGLLLALCVIAIGSASAQTPAGGQLRGRAVDQSGLVMPGADVSLTNDASRDTRHAVTDTDGRFVFTAVPAGTYTITIAFPGLKRAESAGIEIRAGDDRALDDLVLGLEGIEESVVVTARRREENLQDVPISVTAFSGETLRELGVRDLRGISYATPNMEFSYAGNGSGGGNFAQIFLRGVGQPDFIITKDPGVGVYVDNVYFARAPGSVLELLDVERVEVLRGPQGTLFGKNTIGGAVQVVTKRPTGQFGGEAQLGLGRFGRVDGSASLDFPIVEGKLAGRVAGLARTQDGYYRRLAYLEGNASEFGADVSRENGNDTGREAGRVALLWTPSKTVGLLFSADMVNERQEPTEYQAVALSTPANIELYQRLVGTPSGLRPYASYVPSQPWTTFGTWPGYNNSDIWGTSMTLTWEGHPVAVKSITAYRDLFVQTKGDADATPLDIVAPGGVDIWQHQISQEVQLSGTGFSNRLSWVGGFWFFDETARDIQRSRMLAGLYDVLSAAPFQSIAPGGNPNGVCPAANCLGGGITNANDRAIARLSRTGQRRMENDSYAVFAHGTFALTQRWSVTLGGRQSHEAKAFTYSEIYPLLPLPYRRSESEHRQRQSELSADHADGRVEYVHAEDRCGVQALNRHAALRPGLHRVQGGWLQRTAQPVDRPRAVRTRAAAHYRGRDQERLVSTPAARQRGGLLQPVRGHPDLAAVADRGRRARRRERGRWPDQRTGARSRGRTSAGPDAVRGRGLSRFQVHLAPARCRAGRAGGDRQHQPRRRAAVLADVHLQRQRDIRAGGERLRLLLGQGRLSLQ